LAGAANPALKRPPLTRFRNVVPSAAQLALRAIERWSAGDLEAVYADWDPEIIVRPDSNFPDTGELVGQRAARRFFDDNREFMGPGQLEILDQHDVGERCLLRIRQHVVAPSGVRSSYDWSILTTACAGKVIANEFFIDHDRGLAALGAGRAGS
jgi:ketosteroid isomerase-like protein